MLSNQVFLSCPKALANLGRMHPTQLALSCRFHVLRRNELPSKRCECCELTETPGPLPPNARREHLMPAQ